MFDNQVGHHQNDDRPQHGLHRVTAQFSKIGAEILWVALQMAYQRCPHILQAPTANHGIIACNQEASQHTHIAYQCPRRTTCQFPVGASRIGVTIATYDEFANHAGNA